MAALAPLLQLPGMAKELARVEEALRASVVADDPFLTELTTHLVAAGGKRWRPALAVAAGSCASGTGPVSDEVVLGGVAVELVHLGSLYHDDVMDEAATRRGVESVNARWGNLRAILAGDFLLAKASEIAASLGTEVAALLAATIGDMCTGQVRELQTAYNATRNEEQYLAAIDGKTASLAAAACRIGALVAELPRPQVDALTAFGQSFGMAFQIVDDVLDVVATEEQLGKPAGNDLAEGVYTLPVIRALAAPGGAPELASLLGRPLGPAEIARARALVQADGAVAGALVVAEHYRDEAIACVADLDCRGAGDLVSTANALLDTVPT
ncbi:MAG TPA: polyprenyl synthetase family protein [Acidimicrobiales bacterium]|nr:polyprenyl synthetase family protein [Acidimicrobiales bacterium]